MKRLRIFRTREALVLPRKSFLIKFKNLVKKTLIHFFWDIACDLMTLLKKKKISG